MHLANEGKFAAGAVGNCEVDARVLANLQVQTTLCCRRLIGRRAPINFYFLYANFFPHRAPAENRLGIAKFSFVRARGPKVERSFVFR